MMWKNETVKRKARKMAGRVDNVSFEESLKNCI